MIGSLEQQSLEYFFTEFEEKSFKLNDEKDIEKWLSVHRVSNVMPSASVVAAQKHQLLMNGVKALTRIAK